MDLSRFGLTRRPFRPAPDCESYFPAPSHEAAVTALNDAFADRDGLALIDGEPGVGKTLCVYRFLAGLPDGAPTAFIPNPRFARPADLFQAILFDLGVAYLGLSEQELRLAVADRLIRGLSESDAPAVIAIDEAQHLSAEILEEVRLLGNIEGRSAKAAFVVLCGLPDLRGRLGDARTASLSQRIAVRARIEPLTEEESANYLRHQIEACGGDPAELLGGEALSLLAAHCRGVPRLLNQAAAAAFGLTASADEGTVDAEPVLEALDRLGLAADEPAPEPADVRPMVGGKPKGRKRRSA